MTPSYKRQACDRCHIKKLRCVRTPSSDGSPCSRCRRQNVDCVYHSSTPNRNPITHHATKNVTSSHLSNESSSSAELGSSDAAISFAGELDDLFLELSQFPASIQLENTWWPLGLNDMADLHDATEFLGHENTVPDPALPYLAELGSERPHVDIQGPKLWPLAPDAVELCVRQLSDLNVRLYSVYRVTCVFRSTQGQQNPTNSLITDAAFQCASIMFGTGSTIKVDSARPCKALDEAFSISLEFLVILQRLQRQALTPGLATSTIASNELSGACHATFASSENFQVASPSSQDPFNVIDRSLVEQDCSSSTAMHQHHHLLSRDETTLSKESFTAANHLVLACYTLLLSIYEGLVSALQRESAIRSTNNAMKLPCSAHIRLVVVVNLVYYLFDRIRTAVTAQIGNGKVQPNTDYPSSGGLPLPAGFMPLENTEITILHGLQQLMKSI